MMKGRVAPFTLSTLVHVMPPMVQVARQIIEVPQMTSPQERQLKEYKQKVKKEHDTRFLKGEEHLHMDGDIYENWMDTIGIPQHFQHTTSFAVPTIVTTIKIKKTTNIRRFIGYWTIGGYSGNIASFCNVQTTKTIGIN